METKLFKIIIGNVPSQYVLGRIIGQLDITANLAEDRYKCGYAIDEVADGVWEWCIRSREDILTEAVNNIKKWKPFPVTSLEFVEVKEP